MKRIAIVALMLPLGVAGLYAQDAQERSANEKKKKKIFFFLRGPFTFHELHADATTPPVPPVPPLPSTCSPPLLFLPVLSGGGVLRFRDGSLLVVELAKLPPEDPQDGICINFAAVMARLTETYEIRGGTKRLKHASGDLRLTATVIPVVFTAAGAPQLLTSTGKLEGTISGVGHREHGPDGQ